MTRAVQFENPRWTVDIVYVRVTQGAYDPIGVWQPGRETEIDVVAITEPMQRSEQLTSGAVRLTGERLFFIPPSAAQGGVDEPSTETDYLLYQGDRWRVHIVDEWATYAALTTVREEHSRV